MKLEWMRCFAEIAETGSINKAAENLYLSQPAVTKMMQALEKELNIVLLERKKTGVELTEQGETVFAPRRKQFCRNMILICRKRKN